jgi:endo-1,4-beta-D-glucanase Y
MMNFTKSIMRGFLLMSLCCVTTLYAQINTPSGAVVPFGANTSYQYGIMPTNLPTGGAYGKSQDAADAYIEWKNSYVESCGGTPTRYRVKFDEPQRTVSEGIAYGMLLAVYAADKPLFDGLWAYYKANANHNGFMHWRIDGCSGNSGNNGATDAELDATFALLIAENQWPTLNSPYDYETEAVTMMNKIKQYEIHPTTYQTINGDGWGFGDDCRNPSYQSPPYYKEFAVKNPANASAWNSATTAGYALINNNAHATTGLISDWSGSNGVRNTCNGSPLGVPTDGYGYDACRNPWRMAQDVLWNNDSRAKSICDKLTSYINTRGAGNVRGPLYQNGTDYSGSQHNATFVSTFAMAVMGSSATHQNLMNSMYTETKNTKDAIRNVTLSGYFGNTLRTLSLFMMTGNFWKLGTTSVQDINVAVGTNNVLSGTTYDFQNQQIQPAAGKTITFTIQNKGFNTLNLTGTPRITVTGTNATDFVLTQSVPASLASNATATFTINFRPASVGAKTATVTIPSNDPDEANYTYTITGVGTLNATSPKIGVYGETAAAITHSSTHSLGTATVSGILSKPIKVKNTGDAPLNLTAAVTGTGYTLVSGSPATVAIGDSALLWVSVTRASAGAATGTLTITSNDDSRPSYVVNLTANFQACATSISESGIYQDFDGNSANSTLDYTNANWTIADNPSVGGLNTSGKVARYARPATGAYNGVRYSLCGTSTVVLTADKYIVSVLVYSPAPGRKVLMNLKTPADVANTVTYPSTSSVTLQTTKTNQWERLYFNHSSAIGAANIRHIELFVDPEAEAGAATYYLDDIRLDVAPCIADIPLSGILQDYDNHRNMTTAFNVPGSFSEIAANPSIGASNNSATVAHYVRPATGQYQIIRYQTCGALDLSVGKTLLSMQIYSSQAGVPVTVSLKNAATGEPVEIAGRTVTTTQAGAWETLYFDFASVQGNTNVRAIDIFIDPTATNVSSIANRTYYIDNIRYAEELPCVAQIPATNIFNDFNTNRNISLAFTPDGTYNEFTANPSATGQNTSTTVARYVRPNDAEAQVIRYSACGDGFELSSRKSVISLQVRSPNTGTEVILSLKGANGTTEIGNAYAKMSTTNAWETLNFDFSDYIGVEGIAFLDILIDPNANNIGATTAPRTYHIDNIRYSELPEINVRRGATNIVSGSPAISLGTVAVGDSVTIDFTIINNGGGDLTLSGTPAVALSGTGAANYSIVTSNQFSTTVSGGSSTVFTVKFKPTTAGTKVAAIQIANNDSDENPYYINLTGIATCPPVAAAGTITGTPAICSGATAQLFSVEAVAGATTYTWAVPAGATIVSGQGTQQIEVDFGTTGGAVTVTPANLCQNGTLASFTVAINTIPQGTGVLTGSSAVCPNTNGVVYSIAGITGATTYTWTVPTGASIVSGQNTTELTVNYGASISGSISVVPSNTCGAMPAIVQVITANTLPGNAGAVSGLATVCSGQSGVVYSITPVTGATTYTWTVPAGATITAGESTNSITVSFGSTGGSVSVVPSNTCGNGGDAFATVAISGTANPAGAIAVPSSPVCSNQSGVVYSITPVTGATSYTWTVPTGATITAGQGTNSITVTFGTTEGEITVTPISDCGNGAPASVNVSLNILSGDAPVISGVSEICSNATNVEFSTSAVTGATGYTWTVPAGATITAGTGTTAITVNFGATAGTVSVVPSNVCGTGSADNFEVSISATPVAGAIAGTASLCNDAEDVEFSVAPVAGAVSYTWSVPTGSVITAGAATNSIRITFGGVAGDVVVTPVGACGAGVASTPFAVSLYTGVCEPPSETQTIDGPTEVSEGEEVTYSVGTPAPGSTYTWTFPPGTTVVSTSPDGSSVTVIIGNTSGDVVLEETNSAGSHTTELPVTVSPLTSLADALALDTYEAYPVPFDGETVVRIKSAVQAAVSIRIFDAKGEQVYSSNSYATNQDISLGQELAAGVYFVQVSYENKVQTIRLVKI